jgi:GMP synthase (glutamine-hydrolysing)
MDEFIKEETQRIKRIVGKQKVLCALSGGVDSAVTASLIAKAIGKQLTCLFVDHGLLRKNEATDIVRVFKEHFNVNFIKVNAQKQFLGKLKNVTSPEIKRKIIGSEFIKVFEHDSSSIKDLK